MTAEDDHLTTSLDQASEQMRLLRAENKETRDLLRSKTSSNHWLIAAVAVLSLFALIAAGIALSASSRANTAVEEANASRAEARSAGCRQDNTRIVQHNDLVDATEAGRKATEAIQREIDTLLSATAMPRAGDTAEQAHLREDFARLVADLKATVDSQLAAAKSSIAGTLVPTRDCSTKGLAAYYSNPPKE